MKRKRLLIYFIVAFFIIIFTLLLQFISPHRAESPALEETEEGASLANDSMLSGIEIEEGAPSESLGQELATSEAREEEVLKTSAEEACLNEKNHLYEESDYEKGSLLVSFESEMSLEDASVILRARGLAYSEREGLVQDFPENPWLEVKVPRGEEFLWICRLEEHPSVRGAIINSLINLRQ